MKKLILPIFTVTVLLTGCIVTSVCPFYNQEDLSFDPALIGQWTNTKDANDHWKFEKAGEKAYQLSYTSGDKTWDMQSHLFKLGSQTFLDLYNPGIKDDVQPPPIPSHLLLRTDQISPTVKLTPMNYEWLKDWLAKNPKDLRHYLIPAEKPEDSRLVLTADTVELQRFILKHLKTDEAWKEGFELNRDTPAASR